MITLIKVVIVII